MIFFYIFTKISLMISFFIIIIQIIVYLNIIHYKFIRSFLNIKPIKFIIGVSLLISRILLHTPYFDFVVFTILNSTIMVIFLAFRIYMIPFFHGLYTFNTDYFIIITVMFYILAVVNSIIRLLFKFGCYVDFNIHDESLKTSFNDWILSITSQKPLKTIRSIVLNPSDPLKSGKHLHIWTKVGVFTAIGALVLAGFALKEARETNVIAKKQLEVSLNDLELKKEQLSLEKKESLHRQFELTRKIDFKTMSSETFKQKYPDN